MPYVIVSTHSRAEAAAKKVLKIFEDNLVSTHSRAEAAALIFALKGCNSNVSTHSRAEAAAPQKIFPINRHISFNTQPRGGGCLLENGYTRSRWVVSTHSRAEAAADLSEVFAAVNQFQHTAARRRLLYHVTTTTGHVRFQHTAARRRLPKRWCINQYAVLVSTHSRAEAAAKSDIRIPSLKTVFQHTAARRRLLPT